ncbi:MAG: hypothetical protein ACOCXZ_04010 [Chloroflexota bacterium]
MLHLLTALLLLMMPFTTGSDDTEGFICTDDPDETVFTWLSHTYDELITSESAAIPFDDPTWDTLYEDFRDHVRTFVTACPESGADLDYSVLLSDHPSPLPHYNVILGVYAVDINLDDAPEWLVRMHIRPRGEASRVVVDLLYDAAATHGGDQPQAESRPEPEPEVTEEARDAVQGSLAVLRLWPDDAQDDADARAWAIHPESIYVHDAPDRAGRTYMGITFYPGLGRDPYVGGMIVLRWDEWQPEQLLFIEQDCVFTPWEVDDSGQLVIPTGSIVPSQGCTIPGFHGSSPLPIPGAIMHSDDAIG